MTPEQIAEIEARHLAARDGEWKTTTTENDTPVIYVDHESIHDAITVLFEADWGEVADAEFAAHAHQDVPALLAEVKRLRGEHATALNHVQRLCTQRDHVARAVREFDPTGHDPAVIELLTELRKSFAIVEGQRGDGEGE